MKTKLLTIAASIFMVCSMNLRAQVVPPALTPVLVDGFEAWTNTVTPTNWNAAPSTTMTVDSTTQVVTTNTLYPVQSGTASCKLHNPSTTTYSLTGFSTNVSTTAGMGYLISYYARGKGTITAGVTDGGSVSTNFVSANGIPIKGSKWHHCVQSVLAPATTTTAQFYLKVKSTGTYTNSTGADIYGVDVDSFVVQSYTPKPSESLYNIQYTTQASGNSPYYGQFVGKTGGIVTAITLSSTGQPNGYYVQTSNSHRWAACLVYDNTNAANVALGDSLTFQAEVDEYFNMTELQQVGNFVKVSSGNPVPTPTIMTTQAVSNEYNESVLVGVNNATAQTYTATYGQWTAADASTVPVTIDDKTNYVFTPTLGSIYCIEGPVNYEFSAYNIVPRFASDVYVTTTSCSVGIDNIFNTFIANVYPNPMNSNLTIRLPFIAQKAVVSFVDVLGKEALSNTASGEEISINATNLPAGVYMVRIMADGKSQMVKVIKE